MFKQKHRIFAKSLVAVAGMLSVAVILLPGFASAQSVFCSLDKTMAKKDGSGACVPIGDANLDTNHCNGTSGSLVAVPAETVGQGVAAVDQFCTDKGGIASLGGTQTPPDQSAVTGDHPCGDSPAVKISINIGCKGKGNPIVDMFFAFVRFLSIGVGIAIVTSVVIAGIQFTASRGDAQASAKAQERIRNTVLAFVVYILIYAILNYLIPSQVLK